MRLAPVVALMPALAACTPAPAPSPAFPETGLPFFGDGYRAEGDPCRRVGESAETVNYLDDMADLVGCPADMENLGVFVTETGAREAFRQDGYVIYSVPRG